MSDRAASVRRTIEGLHLATLLPRSGMSRRAVLASASVLALLRMSRVAGGGAATGRLSVGVSGPSYYNGFCPFVNWWKQAAPIQIVLADGTSVTGKAAWDTGFLDPATGELVTPVADSLKAISRIFFASEGDYQRSIGADYSGERFIVQWDGRADVRIDWLTQGGFQRATGPNELEFTLGMSPGNTAITLTVLDSNNPPRNVRIVQARYAKAANDGEIFNPDWIAAVAPFGIVRCMDWCAVNNTNLADFDQLADLSYASWAQPFRAASGIGEHGPKGSVHPKLLCELARRIDARLHVCIPHTATDDFVVRFATYLRDNLHKDVVYELSNECWNASFIQFADCQRAGEAMWPNDPSRSFKYYGFRAAQCLHIIRKVYGNVQGWSGALATQTVNPAVTEAIFAGVEQWLSSRPKPAAPLAMNQLFQALYVTGYFGDVTTCAQPTFISQSNPAVVQSPSHGYDTGDRIRFFVASGMTELNDREFMVTKLDKDSYWIAADARDFTPYVDDTRNYAAPAPLFGLMDESQRRHQANRGEYPTPHQFFIRQVSTSLMTGDCEAGYRTSVSVKALLETHWPAQLALARSRDLELRQYEGGCHLTGDAYLTGYGGNAKYSEYVLRLNHSPEIAGVYSAMFKSFMAMGGIYPSKYLADGGISQFGAWAGIRFWPTAANRNRVDDGNPVWQAVIAANSSAL